MRHAKLRTLISVSGCIGILVLLHFLHWLDPVERILRALIQPTSQALYHISVQLENKTEEFQNTADLVSAYQKAEMDLQHSAEQATAAQIAEQENEELRDQLHYFQKQTFQHVGAEVIGKNIEPLGSTVVINRGTKDSVAVGNPVVVGQGILIGRVMRVEQTLSIVELINDHQSKVAATMLTSDKSSGLIDGGYGISVRMDYIPQNESVHVGDTIVTSGLEKNIPKGLLIGTVEAVEKEAYQPFQSAVISPFANLDKIDLVSVILSS